MKNITLYRKYRPKSFDKILGQEVLVSALSNSISKNKLSHAYLFSGTRGVGKTSVARIFASELKIKPEDIYEIDAASNRGINEIREIRDSVDIMPMSSLYKMYIIDEAHMLTKDAFNALLKTLEEPPAHVIFVLATTEKHKLLPTVISRCQVFDLMPAKIQDLENLLLGIVKKEGYELDYNNVKKIAEMAKGSFRDSLSILQKYISLASGKKILVEDDFDGESEILNSFVKAYILKDKEDLFKTYKRLLDLKISIPDFVSDLLDEVRNSILVKNSKIFEEEFKKNKGDGKVKELKKMGASSLDLLKILRLYENLENAVRPEIIMEIFISEVG